MNDNPTPSIFTLEIAGVPTVAFEAKDLKDAEELTTVDWFLNDMVALRSDGTIPRDAGSSRTRCATDKEIALFLEWAPTVSRRPRGALFEYLAPLTCRPNSA